MRFILIFLSITSVTFLFGINNNDTITGNIVFNDEYQEEATYYLNHLDSFVINTYYKKVVDAGLKMKEENLSETLDIPANKDSVYAKRMAILNEKTPFDLTYNKYVGAFIDLYVYKKRDLTENCLGLSAYYFPIFEEILDKYDIPLEFKYLAIVESALNVKAKSRAGAAGLWQFMYRTGKYYDLEINSYIDERYEIYAATDAACRYFKNLYNTYENWELVIAAYNCGPGNVNKAIRRSGGKRNYWEIRKYLPRETRGYVPAFIAVNYAMNYKEEHNMRANFPDSLNLLTDTMNIKGPFDFNEFASYFCADIDQLDYLNPSYKRAYLPEDGKNYILRLPIGLMNAYLEHKEHFSRYVEENKDLPETVKNQKSKSVAKKGVENIHVVQSGEVLGVIAEKYGCRVSQIKDWNNLYSSRIYEGQKLILYLDKRIESQLAAQPEIKIVHKDNPGYKYHVIKPGDTLWDIANMYDGLTVSELKRLNQGVNYKRLKPGDKLVVSANS